METLKPNSNKYRAEESRKKMDKVIIGSAKVKKKGIFSKFKDMFLAEDISSVKEYIVTDVIIPATKKIVSDTIDTILYGENGGSTRRSNTSYDRVSYRQSNVSRSSTRSDNYRSPRSYDDILLRTKGDAEIMLATMDEVLDTYGFVRVADMFDLAGVSCRYTDNNYGWRNISSAEIVRVIDDGQIKYRIKMPRPVPID